MRAAIALLASMIATGCGDDGPPASPVPDAGKEGGGIPEENYCPPADHPRVHYVSKDASECAGVMLDCTMEQNGFDNACGCGCIDKGDPLCPELFDPAITWVSEEPSECSGEPTCPLGDTPFNDTCGCGCITH